MRTKKRTLGTGAAVAMAMVVAGLPLAADADPGRQAVGGSRIAGTEDRTPRFLLRNPWLRPDTSPGRWGGYRGYVDQAPTDEPPVYDPNQPSSVPTGTARPSGPAPVVAEPSGRYPTATQGPSDPGVTAPATTGPAGPTAPTRSAGPILPTAPGSTIPAPTATGPVPTATGPVPTATGPVPTATGPVPTATGPAPTVTGPAPTPSRPVTGPNRSGLPWPSGVYARGQGPRGLVAFGQWRGRATDVVVDWPARQTWDDVINPDWLYDTWKNTPETKVFGVAPVPEADPGATMAGCAAGAYNAKWQQFGRNIKAAGLDDETIIRLGWEFNGNWYKWQARDPQQFAQCWRQIVSNAEQTAPALRWDWNVNRGQGQSVADARLAYPGDAYVDIVGVDSYDAWPGARTEAGWQAQYSGPYGLKFWADFAAAHGKQLSIGEWGNYPGPATSGQSGGDNPFYIAKMMGFFRSQGSNLAYEAYFNESASYFAGAIFAPAQVPAAAAQYRQSLTQ